MAQLTTHFQDMADETLLMQLEPGRLTDEARKIALDEASHRGLAIPVADSANTESYEGDFVTVARLLEPTEAHVLCGYLRSSGISAITADTNVAQGNPFISGAIGGAGVRVPLAQESEAIELLKQFHEGSLQNHVTEEAAGAAGSPSASPKKNLETFRIYAKSGKAVPIAIKDGFSWGAFVFGPLWFLVNGMWSIGLSFGAMYFASMTYFSRPLSLYTSTGLTIHIGLSALFLGGWIFMAKAANAFMAASLEQSGYTLLATVQAENASYALDLAKSASQGPG